jgi:apolipoprotein N-acyltransferase
LASPRSQRSLDILLLALGAFLYTIAYPPYSWTAAAWITLTPLFLVLRGKSPKAGFVAGLLFGVFACVGVTAWVHLAISAYFALPFPLDVICTLLSYLCFGGVYMGAVAALTCLLLQSFAQGYVPTWLRWSAVPALWVCGEYIRSTLVTGFSWGVLGYTQYQHLPLIQIADITGVYGLSFLLAFSSDIVAEAIVTFGFWRRRFQLEERVPLLWVALSCFLLGIIVVISLYGGYRIRQYMGPPPATPLKVALVQGNVPGEQRWQQTHYGSTLLTYLSVTRQHLNGARPDLVVWPEFALGFHLDKEPRLRAQLNWFTKELDTFLLLGAPRAQRHDDITHFYNSAYLLAPGGTLVDVYDKKQLVPFAEYRLPLFPALVPHTPDAPSEFTPGTRATAFALPHSKFGVMICYEVTYPHLARELVRNGAQFLVNISNDTWLNAGGEAAAAQHFALAVFRAVENRRVLVRAATQGISGFVDAVGRPLQTAALREGALTERVTPYDTVTLYARYGDWFVGVCIVTALIALCYPSLFRNERRDAPPGRLDKDPQAPRHK